MTSTLNKVKQLVFYIYRGHKLLGIQVITLVALMVEMTLTAAK